MEIEDWKSKLNSLVESDEKLKEQVEKIRQQQKEQEKTLDRQHVRIEMDKSGRSGKKATILSGFTCSEEEVKRLAAELKKKFSTGGSVRGLEILIQGDMRKPVSDYLISKGHSTKVI